MITNMYTWEWTNFHYETCIIIHHFKPQRTLFVTCHYEGQLSSNPSLMGPFFSRNRTPWRQRTWIAISSWYPHFIKLTTNLDTPPVVMRFRPFAVLVPLFFFLLIWDWFFTLNQFLTFEDSNSSWLKGQIWHFVFFFKTYLGHKPPIMVLLCVHLGDGSLLIVVMINAKIICERSIGDQNPRYKKVLGVVLVHQNES